jgi:hypothetical protein
VTAAVDQATPQADQASAYTNGYTPDQASAGAAYTSGGGTVQAVTIPEASRTLGVSVETVRRRLRRQQLAGQKLPTAQGFEWRVLLPAQLLDAADLAETARSDQAEGAPPTHAPGMAPSQAPPPASARELARLEAHVGDLRTELAEARTELEARRREVQELHVIIARLTPAPAALPAPDTSEVPEAADQAVDQPTPTQAENGSAYTPDQVTRRPTWWRRAWTLVTGA